MRGGMREFMREDELMFYLQDLNGIVDIAAIETKRLEAKRKMLTSQKEALLKRINDPAYLNVPEAVRNGNTAKVISSPLTNISNFSILSSNFSNFFKFLSSSFSCFFLTVKLN